MLQDDKPTSTYNIQNRSTLVLRLDMSFQKQGNKKLQKSHKYDVGYCENRSHNNAFQIFVKTLNGEIIVLDSIIACNTIFDLKHLIQDKTGIPPSAQRLIFGGKDLNDANTAGNCHIKKESTLQVVLRLKGGMEDINNSLHHRGDGKFESKLANINHEQRRIKNDKIPTLIGGMDINNNLNHMHYL